MKVDRVYSSWFVYYMQEFKLSSSVNYPAQPKRISLTPAVQAGIKNDEYSLSMCTYLMTVTENWFCWFCYMVKMAPF